MKSVLSRCLAFALAGALLVTAARADEQHSGVSVGAAAPNFSLQDQDGKTRSLEDYKGKVLVLEWFNEDCPFVQKHYKEGHMNKLADQYKGQGVVWLAVNSTHGKDSKHNKQTAEQWKIDRPILNDSDGKVGKAYGATNTPHMYVIDKEGRVVYMGAIDDKNDEETSSIASSKNYVQAALDAVLKGESVAMSQTKPYGCTVKYAE
jgi:peroxiredoxin